MKLYKIPLLSVILFFSIGNVQSATLTWQGWLSNDFTDPMNWGVGSLSTTDEFVINKSSSTTVILDANITIKRLELKGGCKLNLNGKKLTTETVQLESGSSILSSNSNSEILYSNANGGELRFINFTSGVTISSLLWPNTKTCPNQLTIRNSKVELNTDVSVNRLHFWTTSSNMGYLGLNGYGLTVKKYDVSNDNTGYIIPNSNSSLIFNNLSASTNNIRFANSSKTPITTGIELKSIQKTGTGSNQANIIGSIELSEKISCAVGTIAITGSLTLLSDATQTAYVGESAGSITTTGGFNVQQYIPGRRVFRFLAHPFNASIALSQLTDDIDITGTGGNTNGFTTTTKNNPSAYYFDAAAADNTSSGLNPGWTDFSNTSSSSWAKASPALIYIRGAKTEGLDGNAYTPSAVTLDMSGTINTGTQSISLTKGANSGFITIGNPYPSPIQMQSIASSQRTNTGSTYWVFDSNLGDFGGYVSKLWDTDSYVLPAYAGFATTLTANGSISFEETDKTTSAPADIFLGGNNLSDLVLNVFVNDRLHDLTRLIAIENSTSNLDYFDGAKMENADINLFTLSDMGDKLSIDARPFDLNTERIALGLTAVQNHRITIQAESSAFLNEYNVTLIDHYTNKQYALNQGISIQLDIDINNNKTYGNQRLELVIGQLANNLQDINSPALNVYPNPSITGKPVNVQANAPIQHIRVMDLSGRLVWETSPENKNGLAVIPETALTKSGLYVIEISTPLGKSTIKHVVKF